MVQRKNFGVDELKSSLDLLPMGIRFGNPHFAEIKVRPNSRYSNVSSMVDYGQHRPKRLDPTKLVTKRRGELFGRIEPANLAKFISGGKVKDVVIPTLSEHQALRTGSFPTKLPSMETTNIKFVVMDLRQKEDYAAGHVRRAVHYPSNHIQNDLKWAPMHRYKNKPDVLIVIYLDDERHGTQAAKLIFEKGFDNIYLMSGAFSAFAKDYKELIEVQKKGEAVLSIGDSNATIELPGLALS